MGTILPTVGIGGLKERDTMYPTTPDLWEDFPYSCPRKGCAVGLSRPADTGHGKDCFSLPGRGGGALLGVALILLRPEFPGAQALECYSCVQKADDGCSPQKTKTVKCAPGVEVCTEAVGAVETSEWGPLVHAPTPSSSSSRAPPPYSPAPLSELGHTLPSSPIPPFQPGPSAWPRPINTTTPLGLRRLRG